MGSIKYDIDPQAAEPTFATSRDEFSAASPESRDPMLARLEQAALLDSSLGSLVEAYIEISETLRRGDTVEPYRFVELNSVLIEVAASEATGPTSSADRGLAISLVRRLAEEGFASLYTELATNPDLSSDKLIELAGSLDFYLELGAIKLRANGYNYQFVSLVQDLSRASRLIEREGEPGGGLFDIGRLYDAADNLTQSPIDEQARRLMSLLSPSIAEYLLVQARDLEGHTENYQNAVAWREYARAYSFSAPEQLAVRGLSEDPNSTFERWITNRAAEVAQLQETGQIDQLARRVWQLWNCSRTNVGLSPEVISRINRKVLAPIFRTFALEDINNNYITSDEILRLDEYHRFFLYDRDLDFLSAHDPEGVAQVLRRMETDVALKTSQMIEVVTGNRVASNFRGLIETYRYVESILGGPLRNTSVAEVTSRRLDEVREYRPLFEQALEYARDLAEQGLDDELLLMSLQRILSRHTNPSPEHRAYVEDFRRRSSEIWRSRWEQGTEN